MPLTRDEAKRNLVTLLQYQTMRRNEYGELLLMVWYNITDTIEDIFVLEVFENFRTPEGKERDVLRFPGMADMWLPGLYMIAAFSRQEFEQCAASDELISRVRQDLRCGRAQIIWPEPPGKLAELLG